MFIQIKSISLKMTIMPVVVDVATERYLHPLYSSQVALLVAVRMAYSPQSRSLLPSTFLTVGI